MGLLGPPNIEKMVAKKDMAGIIRTACHYKKDPSVQPRARMALASHVEELVDAFKATLRVQAQRAAKGEDLSGIRQWLLLIGDGLVVVGKPVVEPLLATCPKRADGRTRKAYVGVLRSIEGIDQQLHEALSDVDPKVRELAAQALQLRRDQHRRA
jgi:hypothetical protein